MNSKSLCCVFLSAAQQETVWEEEQGECVTLGLEEEGSINVTVCWTTTPTTPTLGWVNM